MMICFFRQATDDAARVGGEAVWGEKVLAGRLPLPQGPRQRLLRKGHAGREEGWGGGVRHQGSQKRRHHSG